MLPNSASASSAARSKAAASETSTSIARVRTLKVASSLRAISSCARSISASTMLTPLRASARQMPRPIPLAAPVTNAVLPENSITSFRPDRFRPRWLRSFLGQCVETVHHQFEAPLDVGPAVGMGEDVEPARLDRVASPVPRHQAGSRPLASAVAYRRLRSALPLSVSSEIGPPKCAGRLRPLSSMRVLTQLGQSTLTPIGAAVKFRGQHLGYPDRGKLRRAIGPGERRAGDPVHRSGVDDVALPRHAPSCAAGRAAGREQGP